MASWSSFESEAPALAALVRGRLEAHGHKTIATLRRDGAPRISGTESRIAHGELWIGSMWQALKARDLQRDPRYALHSGSDEPDVWQGDAKVAGRAEEITDADLIAELNGEAAAAGPSHLFRLDLDEVSHVRLNDARDGIVIDLWRPGAEVRTITRR